jgi:hypothetical protein
MTEFHDGDKHDHKPSGRWSEVQNNPNSPNAPWMLETICKHSPTPQKLVSIAKMNLVFQPLASRHVDWYLRMKGNDFDESDALKTVLLKDNGVRSAIGRRLPSQKSGTFTDSFKLEQKHYGLEDARLAWGAIDILDFEANFDRGTLHVWFKDRYEWHPVYPGLYDLQHGDFVRETNCLHAAFVEMKLQGAADFWMIGEATVPLDGIVGYTLGGNLPDW